MELSSQRLGSSCILELKWRNRLTALIRIKHPSIKCEALIISNLYVTYRYLYLFGKTYCNHFVLREDLKIYYFKLKSHEILTVNIYNQRVDFPLDSKHKILIRINKFRLESIHMLFETSSYKQQ